MRDYFIPPLPRIRGRIIMETQWPCQESGCDSNAAARYNTSTGEVGGSLSTHDVLVCMGHLLEHIATEDDLDA